MDFLGLVVAAVAAGWCCLSLALRVCVLRVEFEEDPDVVPFFG